MFMNICQHGTSSEATVLLLRQYSFGIATIYLLTVEHCSWFFQAWFLFNVLRKNDIA